MGGKSRRNLVSEISGIMLDKPHLSHSQRLVK